MTSTPIPAYPDRIENRDDIFVKTMWRHDGCPIYQLEYTESRQMSQFFFRAEGIWRRERGVLKQFSPVRWAIVLVPRNHIQTLLRLSGEEEIIKGI
jgi:hypothetical protein